MKLRQIMLSAVWCTLASVHAHTEAAEIELPADTSRLLESTLPGYAIAQQKCGICHSADYINFQPPGMSLAQWTGEMNKMQHSYGAPLTDAEIKQLGAYLAVTYGSANATDPEVVALTKTAAASKPTDGSAADVEIQALLSSNGCLGCHAVDKKLVGPGFAEVAARYKNQPAARAQLVTSIREGGSGKWGDVVMPPMPNLSVDQINALVDFVLQQ